MSEVSSSAAAGVDNCRIFGLVTLGTTWGCGGGVGGCWAGDWFPACDL